MAAPPADSPLVLALKAATLALADLGREAAELADRRTKMRADLRRLERECLDELLGRSAALPGMSAADALTATAPAPAEAPAPVDETDPPEPETDPPCLVCGKPVSPGWWGSARQVCTSACLKDLDSTGGVHPSPTADDAEQHHPTDLPLKDLAGFPPHLALVAAAAGLHTLADLNAATGPHSPARLRLPGKRSAKTGRLVLASRVLADAVIGYANEPGEAPNPYPEPGDEEGDLREAEKVLGPLFRGSAGFAARAAKRPVAGPDWRAVFGVPEGAAWRGHPAAALLADAVGTGPWLERPGLTLGVLYDEVAAGRRFGWGKAPADVSYRNALLLRLNACLPPGVPPLGGADLPPEPPAPRPRTRKAGAK